MLKLFIIACLYGFSIISHAGSCPSALPVTHPGFCASFVQAGTCYCANSLPQRMCTDMKQIYKRMITVFGNIERACHFQKETPPEVCIEDWNCYLYGKHESGRGLCSGTGQPCI
ncbi:MAG: hypothetical protein CMF38_05555 [Legionellaceae bacterium]|nr:hypothetical protein [Legionellaceae bacterium]HCA90020.1 hypothetical protein [Legionellales bacterium]|tara:strand:- start:924 stop:1265 length:342 start_codon:yes stop_codon:yes gene_type:complete